MIKLNPVRYDYEYDFRNYGCDGYCPKYIYLKGMERVYFKVVNCTFGNIRLGSDRVSRFRQKLFAEIKMRL